MNIDPISWDKVTGGQHVPTTSSLYIDVNYKRLIKF